MGEAPLDIKSTAWRTSYHNKEEPILNENNLPSRDPFKLFDIWFKNVATVSDLSFEEVNAVCLSTVSKDYRPSSRMVLLKSFSDDGFAFYTNYDSKKGKQIEENPNAAMLFYWPKVHRQVRIEGTVSRLPVKSAIDYWSSRPIASRIGSKSSKQSSVIPDREFLLQKVKELTMMAVKDGDASISKPESWGGYLLNPSYFEFWQGQSDRLHDRIIFSKSNKEGIEVGNGWHMYRLSP